MMKVALLQYALPLLNTHHHTQGVYERVIIQTETMSVSNSAKDIRPINFKDIKGAT